MTTVAESSTAPRAPRVRFSAYPTSPTPTYPFYTVLTPKAPPRPASHSTSHYLHFRDLPRPIFRYVSRYMRENASTINAANSEPRLLQIAAPGSSGMVLPWRDVKVPNPFLLLKQQVLRARPLKMERLQRRMDADPDYLSPRPHKILTDGNNEPHLISPIPGTEPIFRTVRLFSPRMQKVMLRRFAPDCLPPSQTNPLSNPRPLLWIDQSLIHWEGAWEPKQKRLLHEGRKVMFKGKKWTRERPAKERATKDRMAGMAKRISQYRIVRSSLWRV